MMIETIYQILKCYHLPKSGGPICYTIDPSLRDLSALISGEFIMARVREMFYLLLKKVQESPNQDIEETWRGNAMGYIIKKDTFTIISDDCDELLTVPLPLFLQALKEWEEYLKGNFPEH